MVDAGTLSWLKKQLSSGYTREQLEGLLRQQGYSEEDINTAFQQAGAVQAQPAGKGSPVAVILIFLFLGLSVAGAIFAYKFYQEKEELVAAVNIARTEAITKQDQMEFRVGQLETELNSSRMQYDLMEKDKDEKIAELNATIRDLQSQLYDLGAGPTTQESTPAYETEPVTVTTETTTEPAPATEETAEPAQEVELVADDKTPLVFPTKNLEWNLEEQLILKTAIYNEDTDWVMFQGRVYCLDEFEEEFQLADIACQWVPPYGSQAFTIIVPPQSTTWRGPRTCFIEFWETDEACEQKQGKLRQESFAVDIF